jgi:secretion/DNA translocation related TadE-like protein
MRVHRGPSGDRGSASIWLVAVGLAIVTLAASMVVAARVLVDVHRARAAADLGALAGARFAVEGAAAACRVADGVVVANRARLVDCRLAGLDLTITVEVTAVGHGWGAPVRAAARAGPVRAGPG